MEFPFTGAIAFMEKDLDFPMFWLACLHHVLELLLQAAIVKKLGPTSGPNEKYNTRFEEFFNTMEAEEVEKIRVDAPNRQGLFSGEDDVSCEFLESTRTFFSHFMSETNKFQWDDYGEFAKLIMVSAYYKKLFLLGRFSSLVRLLGHVFCKYGLNTLHTFSFFSFFRAWIRSFHGLKPWAQSTMLVGWHVPFMR